MWFKNNEQERMMTEYYKQGSNRPDFTLPFSVKIKPTELQKRKECTPDYLLAIAGMIDTVDDRFKRDTLLKELVEELLLYVLTVNENDNENIHK